MSPNPSRFDPAALQAFCAQAMQRTGLAPADADTVAATLVRSDARGWRTHGIARIASYVQMIEDGSFNPRPVIRSELRAGALVVDADRGMGQVVGREILQLARRELAHTASLLVVVRDVGHLGALGVHALAAAEAGLFCMLGQQAPALMAMEGFHRGAIGNNPLAFGCPMPAGDPLVFDMACSTAARGHVLLAAREGKPLPEGWAVDEEGVPTTDAQRALRGAMLPVGGHKGVGLAMMVQVLAGGLAATAESLARGVPTVRAGGGSAAVGAFFWFIAPGAIAGSATFDDAMAQWTGHFLASAREGAARLPGARGAALEREVRQSGLELSAAVAAELQGVAQKLGLSLPQPLPA
jgi:LDH2 family malate/lactate/ureidoglycolate dehydrogenase